MEGQEEPRKQAEQGHPDIQGTQKGRTKNTVQGGGPVQVSDASQRSAPLGREKRLLDLTTAGRSVVALGVTVVVKGLGRIQEKGVKRN